MTRTPFRILAVSLVAGMLAAGVSLAADESTNEIPPNVKLMLGDNQINVEQYSDLEEAYRQYSIQAYKDGKFIDLPLELFVSQYNPDDQTVSEYLDARITELASCEDIETILVQQQELQEAFEKSAAEESHVSGADSFSTRSSGLQWWHNTMNPPYKVKISNSLLNMPVRGDVVHESEGGFGITGHIAIVEGKYYDAQNSQYFIRVVEAVSAGVCHGILCDERFRQQGDIVLRVNTTQTIRNAATTWAVSQLGKDYVLTSTIKDISKSRPTWYCSMLAMAAYKAQGVNIDYDSDPYNLLHPHYMYTNWSGSWLSITLD